ncbi:MAG TPA: amidohydrolase [Dehalococcoidia bacterium]|nr:amidohydrolase [Dehalococcoidia bacterium]
MIIDFHTHVFPPQIKKNRKKYVESDPCFAILYSDEKARLTTTDELIESMDKAGVDVSVILNIGWTTHELCVETNDYILESIARYPQRLVGFCGVQPRSQQAALDELERCVRGGIKGVGEMRPDIQLLDLLDEELMAPFSDTLKKHNLILLTHSSEPMGHTYPGKGAVTPEILYPFITNHPEVPIVCSHWGGGLPFYALMPEVKKVIPNVYFDTAASPFLYNPQIYAQVAAIAGGDRILLGSDWPLLAQERLIKEVESTSLPDETKARILGGNAQKLLGITDNTA